MEGSFSHVCHFRKVHFVYFLTVNLQIWDKLYIVTEIPSSRVSSHNFHTWLVFTGFKPLLSTLSPATWWNISTRPWNPLYLLGRAIGSFRCKWFLIWFLSSMILGIHRLIKAVTGKIPLRSAYHFVFTPQNNQDFETSWRDLYFTWRSFSSACFHLWIHFRRLVVFVTFLKLICPYMPMPIAATELQKNNIQVP